MIIFILRKLALQPLANGLPEGWVKTVHHDFDYGNAIFLRPAAALPETLSGGPQKAGHAAKLVRQFFEKSVKPVLGDRLPGASFFWQKDLHEIIGATAHETLRCGSPCQLSSSVLVVTVSTCSPKRFM